MSSESWECLNAETNQKTYNDIFQKNIWSPNLVKDLPHWKVDVYRPIHRHLSHFSIIILQQSDELIWNINIHVIICPVRYVHVCKPHTGRYIWVQTRSSNTTFKPSLSGSSSYSLIPSTYANCLHTCYHFAATAELRGCKVIWNACKIINLRYFIITNGKTTV